jgi:hypothetical protein
VIVAAVDGGIVRPGEWDRVREFAVGTPASPTVLAVLGEAGAGKSTLWRGGVQAAVEAGRQVLRSEPTASETDLSFAGLSDLLAEALPAVAADIPAPQLEALEVALLLRVAGERPPTAHAVGLAVLAVLRACDAAVLAGVLAETKGRIAASHPLVAAAAVESMPPGGRAQLYRRLAEASADPERRGHFAALAAGPGPDVAVAAALDAAAAAAHARAGNAAAAQFAEQAITFTPESDSAALVRRRIRAGELLFLAGDVEGSLRQLETLDIDRLATPDLERALPLLLDMTDLARGTPAAAEIVTHAVEAPGHDPRRRALVLSLASDYQYGIGGRRRAAAIEAISYAEVAGDAARRALHRALINLVVAKVYAAEGLDCGLLDRAAQLEAELPAVQLHDTADLCRGLWSGCLEDLDTARAALRRCIDRARAAGDDYPLCTFLSYLATVEELAGDYAAAGAALEAAAAVAAWHDWQPAAWHLEPRCELLITSGDLDGAVRLADEGLPDDSAVPLAARFVGARVRGKVSAWRGDPADAVRHLERAAKYADLSDVADPGVRYRIDPDLAEAYVAVGRLDEARLISAWLRDLGGRLGRPALVGDASRIDALLAAVAGDLDAAAESARAAVAAHGGSPLRLELARSQLMLGRIQRRRKARGRAGLPAGGDTRTRADHQRERRRPVCIRQRRPGRWTDPAIEAGGDRPRGASPAGK